MTFFDFVLSLVLGYIIGALTFKAALALVRQSRPRTGAIVFYGGISLAVLIGYHMHYIIDAIV